MLRHFAKREQLADNMAYNTATASHTTYTSYLHSTFENPLPFKAHTIPYPVSDSNDTAGMPVAPTRRSVRNRRNPTLGSLSKSREVLGLMAFECPNLMSSESPSGDPLNEKADN